MAIEIDHKLIRLIKMIKNNWVLWSQWNTMNILWTGNMAILQTVNSSFKAASFLMMTIKQSSTVRIRTTLLKLGCESEIRYFIVIIVKVIPRNLIWVLKSGRSIHIYLALKRSNSSEKGTCKKCRWIWVNANCKLSKRTPMIKVRF